MSDFLDKLKKGVEESYSAIRLNASNIKETAGEYGRIAKLRFEMFQLNSTRDKKMALLGSTVYPYLLENNPQALKDHETLPILLDEIKNISNQIELIQIAINDISKNEKEASQKLRDHAKIRNEIESLEKQIESHLQELKDVKKSLDK
jgi:predicted  nucleic acid-binding Zn-ribbon protein